MTKRPLAMAVAVLAASLAACGGSKAPGVQQAPSSGLTQASVPTTPKVPAALAHKPVVSVPKGAPPTSLVRKDLLTGTGATVAQGQTVTVNYVGVLYKTGKEFDSSWKRNQPFSTALTPGSVIPGWVKGLTGARVGSRRELIIPPNLAYGKAGQPPTIPPNSTLIFVIDVLGVQ
jgi:FKBP-type peptidyl-prolyl cis-trans isomerase